MMGLTKEEKENLIKDLIKLQMTISYLNKINKRYYFKKMEFEDDQKKKLTIMYSLFIFILILTHLIAYLLQN